MFVFIRSELEQRQGGMDRRISRWFPDRGASGNGGSNGKEGSPFRLDRLPFPSWTSNRKAILQPKEQGPGNWVGGANVYYREDLQEYVAIVRDRQEDKKILSGQDKGRGALLKIYTSKRADFKGKNLVATITKDDLAGKKTVDGENINGIVSFERAALDFKDGKPVVYISRAKDYTPDGKDTKDWDIIRVESKPGKPYEFDFSTAQILNTLKGAKNAVKDPVLVRDVETLHMFYTCHPLDKGTDNADQMWTEWMTSEDDGVTWTNRRKVMDTRTRPNEKWNSWGSRVTAVLWDYDNHKPIAAFYDGKANRTENKYERTDIAYWNEITGQFETKSTKPITNNRIRTVDEYGVVQLYGAFRYSSFTLDKKKGVINFYSEQTMRHGKKGTFWEEIPLYKIDEPDPHADLVPIAA